MNLRQLPNTISVVRILLVLPLVWAFAEENYQAALALVIIAGISDGVDGYLARRFGWGTRLGTVLDPIGDKVLLVSSFFMLGWLGQFPFWLVALVIGRDVVIVAGAVAYHLLIHHYEMAPTLTSKLNTLMQILLVTAVLVSEGVVVLPQAVLSGMVFLVLLTTLLSGLEYVWVWGRRACRVRCVRGAE